MLRSTPSFTVTLRGYDKEEVDEYIETLHDGQEVEAAALEEAAGTVARLEQEVANLTERADDLESCLRSETPRSIFALGQRLTLILEQAEDAATETVSQATEEATRIRADAETAAESLRHDAQLTTEEAEARAAAVTQSAEDTARRLEEQARQRAEALTFDAETRSKSLIADAEGRAVARAREMEEWAARMHEHLRHQREDADAEFARIAADRRQDLADLAARRDAVVRSMDAMRAVLHQSVTEAREATISPEDLPAPLGTAAPSADTIRPAPEAPQAPDGPWASEAPGDAHARPAGVALPDGGDVLPDDDARLDGDTPAGEDGSDRDRRYRSQDGPSERGDGAGDHGDGAPMAATAGTESSSRSRPSSPALLARQWASTVASVVSAGAKADDTGGEAGARGGDRRSVPAPNDELGVWAATWPAGRPTRG